EELVAFAAGSKNVRVVTSADLVNLVRQDDHERTYNRKTLIAAARELVTSDSFPPEYLVVSDDALSLSDAVQAFTHALAAEGPANAIAVRTMLGPFRARGRTTAEFTTRAKDVRAAAAQLVTQIEQPRKPDALPATVSIGDHDAELEAYLYAAAKFLLGEDGALTVPALRPAGPDPARWTIKPARMAH
ncbi:MAG: hypothetical protein GY953_15175, partial [bacterium]|nr:hypothetical protein [bacterium]